MAIHDDVAAFQAARPTRPASPTSPANPAGQTGPTGPAGQFGSAKGAALAAGQQLSQVAAHRRPLWRWLLVGLLGVFSLGVTAVYVATVTVDVRQHHWAGMLDASRVAVPAAVGWAALLILFFGRGAAKADQLPTADEYEVTEKQKQATLARDSVCRAEQCVLRLAARLAELSAEASEDAQNRQLARQIGDTAARLDLARQWLIGARAALAASQSNAANATGTQPTDLRHAGRAALLLLGKAAPAEHDGRAKDLLGGVCRGARRDHVCVRLVQVA